MSDNTLQTILHNVIEMRGELSSVIQKQADHDSVASDVAELKKLAAEDIVNRKWHYKIAAGIGALVAFSFDHLPHLVAKGFASIFNGTTH